MAVTILQTPPQVAYSRRTMPVMVETNRYLGRAAVVSFSFTGTGAADGETFTLSWNGFYVQYTFKTVPTSNDQLPVKGNLTWTVYLKMLYDALSANYQLEDWVVTTMENVMRNRYRVALQYRFIEPLHATVVGALSNTIIGEAVNHNPYFDVNLSCYLRLLDSTNAPFGAPMNVPYRTDATATFDLQTAFADLTCHLPPVATLTDAYFRLEVASRAYKAYKFRVGDKSGSPPQPQALVTSAVYYAIHGSLDNFPASDKAVLLHRFPILRKPLSIHQPDYAYLWMTQSFTNCFVELTLYLSNGTALIHLPEGTSRMYLSAETLYLFRTGYKQLKLNELAMPAGVRITGFDWRILNDNSGATGLVPAFTEVAVLRYDVSYTAADAEIYLLCDNGMGGMETLRLVGSFREKYAVEMTDIQSGSGEMDTFGENMSQTMEVATQMMPTEICRYYRQLLLRPFWWIHKGQFVKTIRVTKELELNPRIPFNALKFAFQIAQKEL
jgi:hypothetical protein